MNGSQTDIYVLIGNPVGHSLSPLMHNCAYKEMGLDAHYVSFCVEDLRNAVSGLRALNISGVSVTIPFKTEVIQYLDEVDGDALKIGAVNTIINEDGRLKGKNTDWLGIVLALKEAMEIKDKTFVVMGAGGTARAALFGIVKEGGLPVIVNRTEEKGLELAQEWGLSFRPLYEIRDIKADGLINTTPVGMYPRTAELPLPPDALPNFGSVMDVVYNPLQTRLLSEAKKAGCRIISGADMFVHQGAEQIKIWTGKEPPRALMREVVINRLMQGLQQVSS
jgi:shikimate dehydrogenase